MSGIDKIISEIETDTQKVCDDIIAQAQQKADAILAEAETKAQSVIADGKERAAAHVADIKKRGDSAADLEEKKILLYTKQNIIQSMLRRGMDTAKALPDDAYFALILRMVEKYSLPEDGVIVFGAKDTARMPFDYPAKLNEAAKGKLTIAAEPAEMDAGFILQYGGIEQNCSFDAIFSGEAENLSDRAGRLLFS